MDVWAPRWLPLIGIACVTAVPFVVPWLQGHVYGTFDLGHITIPLEEVFARYQRAGHLPTWAPEFHGGFPLLANGIQSFFYAPHALLRMVLPSVWAVNLSLLLHAWLSAAGMWLLLRAHGLTRAAAFAGSVAAGIGGYTIGRITLPHLLFAAAWLPLILWAQTRLFQKPTPRRGLVLATTVAASLFAGHPQIALYTAFAIAITTLAWGSRRSPLLPRRLVVLAGAIGGALLLAAVHLLPTHELLPHSRRGALLTGPEAFDVSYPPGQLLTVFMPKIFGSGETYFGAKNEPELLVFFGISGLFLGGIALFTAATWRSALGRAALGMVLVGALLAGGEFSPFYRALHAHLPVVSRFANPGRALLLVHIGWSVLLALGVNGLFALSRQRQRVLCALFSVATLAGVAWGAWQTLAPELKERATAVLRETWIPSLLPLLAVTALVAVPRVPRRFSLAGLSAVLAVELLRHAVGAQPVVPQAAWKDPPRVLAVVPARNDAPRVFSHQRLQFGNPQIELGVGELVSEQSILRQTFTPQREGLDGLDVHFTWNGRPPQHGTLHLRMTDAAGTILRDAAVPLRVSTNTDDEFVASLDLSGLQGTTGKPLSLVLRTDLPNARAPRVFQYANSDGGDIDPTGELTACTDPEARNCRTLAGTETARGPDLALVLRFHDTPTLLDRELLLPLFGEAAGRHMVRGHLALQLSRVDRYLFEMGERDNFSSGIFADRRQFLDRMSAGTLVAAYGAHERIGNLPDVAEVAAVPVGNTWIRVYRNETALPRVHFAKSAQSLPGFDEVLSVLRRGDVHRETALVERVSLPRDLGKDGNATLTVDEDTPTRFRARTDSTSPELLVVRDVFAPGWSVSVDGMPETVTVVDGVFRGVLLPPGAHAVTFTYHAPALRLGMWISGLSWGVVLLAGVRGLRQPRHAQRTSEASVASP